MHYQKRRLFIGIHLSPFLRKKLAQEVAAWGKEVLIPTREENFHISLHHLGFVLEDQIPALCIKLQDAVANIEAFDVTFTGMEVRESLENPKMISLTGEPSVPLKLLYEEIEKALGMFMAERKSFRPQVAMAQIKKAKWLTRQTAGEPLPNVKENFRANDPVESITLFETTVRDGKKLHDPLATASFGQQYE